ncbi:hypothetical protein Tco_0889293 [Tanacetum coccineum]
MTQKEETYQVVLDIIKNTTFYNAFLASADALNICPRVPGKEFIVPPSKEELLTFLIELGYKGELTHLPQMFIDHMHQPWRTVASIINKCLSGKITSNDKLCQSRLAIIWGMFHKKYINFAELILEDFSYQIDNRQLKKSRREIMPYPRFPKLIINHFLSIHKSVPKALPSGLHTIKDDGVLSRMKFVRIGEDKSAVTLNPASVEVSDDSDPKPARRQTGSRRKSKKKVSISADDNIILEPNVALELGKSISLTEAKEEEAARRVYATHERLVTESDEPSGINKPTGRRRKIGVVIQDTPNVPKKISVDQSQKLKGSQTLTPKEQLAADTLQALKASKKISRSQPHTGGSSEGTGVTHGFLMSSEEESEYSEEENVNEEIEWVSTNNKEEKNDDDDDDRSIDIAKMDDDEETDDEFVHGDEYVHDDVDEEMKDVEVTETGKDDEEINDAEKTDAKKTKEVKDDNMKVKLPPTSSTLSVSLGFGNQFLNLSSDKSLVRIIKDSKDAEINSLLDIQIQQEISGATCGKRVSWIKSWRRSSKDKDDLDRMFHDQPKLKKRDHGDDKDEDPSARPNQGKKTKRRRTKESKSSKKTSTTKETSKGNAHTKGSKSDKSVHVEESVAETTEEVIMDASNDDVVNDADQPQNDPIDKLTKAHLVGPVYNLLKGTCQSSIELEYNMEECYKALSDQLDWNNLEGDSCPFALSKPIPLKGHPGHLTIASEYFFNNDLRYLKSSDQEKMYTTSIIKTKAARYELVGIEDMIPSLWSVTKVGYDKDAKRGIKHWGPTRKLFYRSQLNRFSKHDVYSHLKILSVKSVKVNKLHGYSYLEEIVVRRFDRQLYKFKEGNFVNLHLNDIEDMLLLVVQHKLFHLDRSDIVDLAVALHFPRISAKELYTPSFDPPGVVYEDLNKKKRVMQADELYKFSDRTLKLVRDELHHKILNFHLGYNKEMSRRKWSAIDKRRSELMVELIDKQMGEKWIIRNLERLVGSRELKMDYRLMQRSV